jgi:hypothetical protein
MIVRALQRHRSVVVLAVGAVLVIAWALAADPFAVAHGARGTPVLTLVQRDPATFRGRGFAPHTRVKATLVSSQTQTRRVRTDGNGGFTVVFATPIDFCSGFSVSAQQPGRAVVVLRGPRPECAPA